MRPAEARAALTQLGQTEVRVLSLATTGFHGYPVSVSIVTRCATLLDTRLFTHQPIEEGASKLHGLTNADLVSAPWPADLTGEGHQVVVNNRGFLNAALERAARLDDLPALPTAHWIDVQPLLAAAYGTWSEEKGDYRFVSLEAALRAAQVEYNPNFAEAGTSLGNAQRLLAVLQSGASLSAAQS